jgi:hypothetical protein
MVRMLEIPTNALECMHSRTITNIVASSGRSLTVVPRSVDSRGYVDANQDNVVTGNAMATWKANIGLPV